MGAQGIQKIMGYSTGNPVTAVTSFEAGSGHAARAVEIAAEAGKP